MSAPDTSAAPIRSVQRAFAVLELLVHGEDHATLTSIAAELGLSVPTTFRIMRTLVATGYARQPAPRRYALGPGLLHLGDRATQRVGAWARPTLQWLVEQLQETANLAMLDGDQIVYLAQAPSQYGMRMSAEVGHRVHAHSSGVGKAILATLADEEVRALLTRTGMPASTPATLVTEQLFFEELDRIRLRGYAIDDGEQELGVRCLAVVVAGWLAPMAVSISGPSTRVPIAATTRYAETLQSAADRLARLLGGGTGPRPVATAVGRPRTPESPVRSGSPSTDHGYDQLWP